MRTLILAAVLLFSATLTAQEAVPISAEQRERVIAAVEAFLYGASVNDVQAHDKFWAPELTYTSSSGTRFGKEQLMAGMTDAVRVADEQVSAWYTAEDIELKSFGDAVIVNFTLIATSTADASRETFLNTGVLVERRDGWQAVNWNATRTAATNR